MCSWMLKKCLLESKLNLEWGATLDILRKAKNASRKAALCRGGSSRILQVVEMSAKVLRSKMPRGVGLKEELIEILLV